MEEKRCRHCDTVKSVTSFYRRGTRYRSECKECGKKKLRTYYQENETFRAKQNAASSKGAKQRKAEKQAYVLEYLRERMCVDCGEQNLIVLQFDHHNDDKDDNVAYLMCNGGPLASLVREIEKCEVVCANCHIIRTARRANNYRYQYIHGPER